MRILINIAVFLIVALAITSCGGDASTKADTTPTQSKKEKPAPTFKMANEKSTSTPSQSIKAKPIDKSKIASSTGGAFSNKAGNNPVYKPTQANIDQETLSGVPDACALISTQEIAKIFGIKSGAINQKDASHTKSPFTRSCFYRWDGASANTGILLQVQANPVAEEYAEWVTLFVESKRTSGEKEMGNNETYKYEKLEGLGDDGSYSHRLGKYVWRVGNDYAFMVAFNTNSAAEVQMKNVQKIGKIMMSNYAKLKK